MEYMVKIWGAGKNEFAEDYPNHKEYGGCLYYYFNDELEMQRMIANARNYSKGCVVASVAEGNLQERVVACMDLVYENVEYYHEQDFGYGYSAENAEFMYFEGNYSCDCNKRLFLSREYGQLDFLDDESLNCTDDIEIRNFRIEMRK